MLSLHTDYRGILYTAGVTSVPGLCYKNYPLAKKLPLLAMGQLALVILGFFMLLFLVLVGSRRHSMARNVVVTVIIVHCCRENWCPNARRRSRYGRRWPSATEEKTAVQGNSGIKEVTRWWHAGLAGVGTPSLPHGHTMFHLGISFLAALVVEGLGWGIPEG